MRLLVVGFGSVHGGDDGAGPAVVARLRAGALPRGLRVEEGGTDALRLPSLLVGERRVWIVDAMQAGGRPGQVHRLDHPALLAFPQAHRDAHHLSLPQALRTLAAALPEMGAVRYRLWGLEPERLGPGQGLSPAVAAAVVAVAEEIRNLAAAALARGDVPRATPCA